MHYFLKKKCPIVSFCRNDSLFFSLRRVYVWLTASWGMAWLGVAENGGGCSSAQYQHHNYPPPQG